MDEAAKDWTKKLAELSGMWSKQTGSLVLWYSSTVVLWYNGAVVVWSKEKCAHNSKKSANKKFRYSLVQQPSSLLGISGFDLFWVDS